MFLSWLKRCPISGQQVLISIFTFFIIVGNGPFFASLGCIFDLSSSSSPSTVNGVCDELQSLGVEGRPVSLFQCQVLLLVASFTCSAESFHCQFCVGVAFQGLGECLER